MERRRIPLFCHPAVSQLDKRSLVVTYDITSFLKSGKNEILLWLGKGWYKKTTFKAEHDGPVVRADLSTLKDGKWKKTAHDRCYVDGT